MSFRARLVTAALVASAALAVGTAHAVVLCQHGKRLILRPAECTPKEQRLVLDAETLAGMTPEELLAALEARIAALENLIVTTSTTTSTSVTSTTVAIGGTWCTCNDQSTLFVCGFCDIASQTGACVAVCIGHGGIQSIGECLAGTPCS